MVEEAAPDGTADASGVEAAGVVSVRKEGPLVGAGSGFARIKARVAGAYEELVLNSGCHAPHFSHPHAVIDSIAEFSRPLP